MVIIDGGFGSPRTPLSEACFGRPGFVIGDVNLTAVYQAMLDEGNLTMRRKGVLLRTSWATLCVWSANPRHRLKPSWSMQASGQL
ncbi:MAG: hypothetical protein AAGG72_02590 [Pseudomonadota bacterium]